MRNTATYIARLILKKVTSELTTQEQSVLDRWRTLSPENQEKYEELLNMRMIKDKLQGYVETERQSGLMDMPDISAIEEEDVRTVEGPIVNSPARRVPFLRKWGWAAAIILLAGAGAYFYMNSKKATSVIASRNTISSDIPPGTNRAMLTVDNNTINLASNKTGIAIGNSITYNDGERIADIGQQVTLSTPRGGQYQAVLPDGSRVWLNAASSIKFPSRFIGNTREIEVTGEVYMEVAQNLKQPFSINAGGAKIQVLGTSFNVNAYEDENTLKTTLIDGSVKVLTGGKGEMLKPGQQAVVASGNINVESADIEQTLAWKNGLFNFDGAYLPAVMRQLERWYDIKVKYKGSIPQKKYRGGMYRNVALSDVLEMFKEMGVRFELDGKTLIVF